MGEIVRLWVSYDFLSLMYGVREVGSRYEYESNGRLSIFESVIMI